MEGNKPFSKHWEGGMDLKKTRCGVDWTSSG